MTQKQFIESVNKKVDELCKLISKGKDLKYPTSSLVESAIIELAIWGCYNHYESLGVIEEAKLNFRNTSITLIEEEQFEEEHFPVDIEITNPLLRNLKFQVCISQLDEPENLDCRTELLQNYLIQNDINPLVGDIKDWKVTDVDNVNVKSDCGEIWVVSK